MLTSVKENKKKQKYLLLGTIRMKEKRKRNLWTELFIKVSTGFYRFLVIFYDYA